MNGSALPGSLVLISAGILLIGLRLWAERSERGRMKARQLYEQVGLPHYVRLGSSLAPLIAPAIIAFGIVFLVPRPLSAWLLIAVLTFMGVTFLLAYRDPPPLMPGWMREEILAGRLPVARPDTLDWVLFWIAAVATIVGPIAGVLLIVVFDAVKPA